MNYADCEKKVDKLMAALHAQAPATPVTVRKILIDFLSDATTPDGVVQDVKAMLGQRVGNQAGFRIYWSTIAIAAEILRRKDGYEFVAGEFLYRAIGEAKRQKKMQTLDRAWKAPRSCSLCYRISGERKFCSRHDRTQNEAGYRRGRRIKSRYRANLTAVKEKRPLPENINTASLAEWMKENTPTVAAIVGDASPLEILAILDDESRPATEKFRKLEHLRMVERTTSDGQKAPRLFESFLYRAEAWHRAAQQLKHGGARPKTGGARPGAGRPRKKA